MPFLFPSPLVTGGKHQRVPQDVFEAAEHYAKVKYSTLFSGVCEICLRRKHSRKLTQKMKTSSVQCLAIENHARMLCRVTIIPQSLHPTRVTITFNEKQMKKKKISLWLAEGTPKSGQPSNQAALRSAAFTRLHTRVTG